MRTSHRVLLALCAALPLAAQEAGEDRQLEALLDTPVSSVSKRNESLLTAPQAVEVLAGDDLRAMGIYRLSDALRLLTSVNILELDSHVTHVGLRGVMQDGQPRTVQILVDGVPLYNAEFGAVDIDNLPVAMDLVDRIEVVRGPSSTLYGANAVAGVIAITTRTPLQGFKAGARLSVGENGVTRHAAHALWASGLFSVRAGYSGQSQGETNHVTHYVGDPATPPYIRDPAHGMSAFVRPQWQKDDTTVWLEYGRANKKTWSVAFPYERGETEIGQAGWRQRWSDRWTTEFTYSLTRQGNLTGPAPNIVAQVNDPGFYQEYRYVDYGHQQAALQVNWDPTEKVHLVLGADHRKYEAGEAPVLGFRERAKESASSGFANLDWNISKSFTLSAGVRAEDETIGGSRVSPRLAAIWSPTEKSSFRAGYYASTRSPQLSESRTSFSNAFGLVPFPDGIWNVAIGVFEVLPNEDLDPETIRSVEAGWRQAFGPVTVDLTVFRMKFKDLIVEEPVGQFPVFPACYPSCPAYYYIQARYENGGSATDEGVELAVTWQPVYGLTLGGNSTWLSYHHDETDAEQAYAPRAMAALWGRFNRDKFTAYAGVQRQSEQLIASLNVGGVPTYERRKAITQFHASLGYEFWKGLSLTAYAFNGAKEFTPQGAGGSTRSSTFRDARREAGFTLGWSR